MPSIGLDFDLQPSINDKGVYSLLHSQRGAVANDIRSRGKQIVKMSKALVGKSSGNLARSIKMNVDRTATGGYGITVGSDLSYALMHHEGTRPHVITPKRAGGYLVFSGRSGGRVYARRVRHPGTAPNQYLVNALRAVIR